MAFKHRFFDVDFRNSSINAQKDTVDTFFQAHTIEFWGVGENETLFGVYDENNTAGASRFTIFDSGTDGIKSDLSVLNQNINLANFVAANEVLKSVIVNDQIILVQYRAR